MGPESFLDRLRDLITSVSFRVFLWSIGQTDDEYWTEVYEIESARREEAAETST